MNMKKVITLTFILIGFAGLAMAQPRVNGTKTIPKLMKSSALVSNITGWAYEYEKQRWCGYKNAIYHEYKNNSKIPVKLAPAFIAKKEYFGWLTNNIINIQTRKYSFEGRTYYMFLLQSWTAYYDYPAIQVGYHYLKTTDVYMTTQEEFSKICSPSDSISKIIIKHLGGTPKRDEWFPSYNSIQNLLMDNFHTNDTTLIKEIIGYEDNEFKMYSHCGYLYFKKEGNNVRFSPFGVGIADFMREHYEMSYVDWKKLFL